ncbi:hypothetical protein GCM10010129_11510 [Streptomyces fumigatiscleroticus]|nr:hypothetical protein GCM10010129_11510 [Streptomyces fumigatiscleroticus]
MTGRYRLAEIIGQGGMGRVWRAADEILDRPVAVKEMRIDGLDAEDARTRRERTLREARATARIDHPHVVRVYDVVDEGERLWIVMELVAGRSLERTITEDGPLGPRETARIGLGLVAALGQVHARGVLHRDIKPGNVLVESGGRRVVLTDFGIAAIQDAKALTMVGMLVGSPDYMAPERVAGRPQGPPSDVWSLGATLCAALGGRSPFARDTTLATLHAVLYEEPELPDAAGPLREVLAALLEKEPADRPGLDDVAAALEPVAFPVPTPTLPVGAAGADPPAERATAGDERPTAGPEPAPAVTPEPGRDAAARTPRDGPPGPGGPPRSRTAGAAPEPAPHFPPRPTEETGPAATPTAGTTGRTTVPEAQPPAVSETAPDHTGRAPAPEPVPEPAPRPVSEPVPEAGSRPQRAPEPESGSVPQRAPAPEPVPAPEPRPVSEPVPEAGSRPQRAPEPESGSVPQRTPAPEPAPEPRPVPQRAPEPESGSVPQRTPAPKPAPEPRSVPQRAPEPVPESRSASEPAPAPHPPAPDGSPDAPPHDRSLPSESPAPEHRPPPQQRPKTPPPSDPETPFLRRVRGESPTPAFRRTPRVPAPRDPRRSDSVRDAVPPPCRTVTGEGRAPASASDSTSTTTPDHSAPPAEPGPPAPTEKSRTEGRPAAPATPRRHRARRRAAALAGAVGLAVAGAVVAVVLTATSGSPDGTGSSTSAPPTVGGTSRPPSPPASPPPGAHREAGGFAWTTPDGWRRDVKTGAEVHYTSPDGRQELAAKSSLARGDLLESWRTSERNARQGQDYRKIRLEETRFRGHPAVVWEYTFTLKGVPWHARLLGFTVDGKSYQVNTWYRPEIEDRARGIYEEVKDSFTVL